MMYDRELNFVRKKAQSWEIFVVLLQIPMVTYKYATEWATMCSCIQSKVTLRVYVL